MSSPPTLCSASDAAYLSARRAAMSHAQRLTTALWLAGLAPEDTALLPAEEGPFFYLRRGGRWDPTQHWSDAMPIFVQCHLALQPRLDPATGAADGWDVLDGAGAGGREPARTATGICWAICRLALRAVDSGQWAVGSGQCGFPTSHEPRATIHCPGGA